eukprot:TRINITY_DN699_c0_g1_i1.p1 TRINITY_DN699_c0_g1~~TRINITY_DN699_c0_g1_i1.p1  ORF type:complete len:395 (+),score=118.67 TRINITY_DN699_c0_g1_i1:38-1222(+)
MADTNETKPLLGSEKKKGFFASFNLKLTILLVVLIIIGTTNRVTFKRMLNAFTFSPGKTSYTYFISQFTSLIYLPFFWPIVWYLMLFTKRVTPEMRKFPIWKYLVMGGFDAIAGLFMVFGGASTSGPIQMLFMQANIPFTMLFSWIVSLSCCVYILKKTIYVNYRWSHYTGASLIIAGIVVALISKLLNNNTNNTVFGMVIFFLAAVPNSFSGVYKEIAFKGEVDLDVFYMNAWVALFQFILGIVTAPIISIPGFGGDDSIPLGKIPEELWFGARCLFGYDSRVGDECGEVWIAVLMYVVANIGYNIALLLVIKYGSAALFYVASAVMLPLADICFTFEFIMGKDATPLSLYDIIGLVLILAGLILYRFLPESKPQDKEDTSINSVSDYNTEKA